MNSTVACPRNYLCELHRNRDGATVNFCGNFCFECGPCAWWRLRSRDFFVCVGCSKKLCKFYASAPMMRSLNGKTSFDAEGGHCRQCSRNGLCGLAQQLSECAVLMNLAIEPLRLVWRGVFCIRLHAVQITRRSRRHDVGQGYPGFHPRYCRKRAGSTQKRKEAPVFREV